MPDRDLLARIFLAGQRDPAEQHARVLRQREAAGLSGSGGQFPSGAPGSSGLLPPGPAGAPALDMSVAGPWGAGRGGGGDVPIPTPRPSQLPAEAPIPAARPTLSPTSEPGFAPTLGPTSVPNTPPTVGPTSVPPSMKIVGTKFTPYSTVLLGGIPAPSAIYSYISPTEIRCQMSPGSSVAGTTTVTVVDHGVASTPSATFTWT